MSLETINRMKCRILQVSKQSQEGHVASAFSILDILQVLYERILIQNQKKYYSEQRDRFILSKGHASLGLYSVLEEFGLLTDVEMNSFGKYGSKLGGHPDRNKIQAVEASTGSLGHGLPIGVGIALGYQIKKWTQQIYVLVGDGELNEGSMWEAVMLAQEHQLNNLSCIIDYNHSTDRALMLGNIEQKFKAFGWETVEIDGHNQEEIYQALIQKTTAPKAIVAHTIKGNGISVMEGNPEWHHKSPTEAELKVFLEELQ